MPTPYQDRKLPAPVIYPENQAYWDAAVRGELMVPHCNACGPFWYPRPYCPHCGSGNVELKRSTGQGIVYSLSITRRAGPIPYAIAYVTLDEGVTIMTNLADCDLDSVRIDDRVEVVFKPTDGGPTVPLFRPVAASAA
ncbi:MAG: DNA-binding protein [Betaproteobacteria bacterium]|nr:DNA-binding protein [Betaproteobacteria bacterium]